MKDYDVKISVNMPPLSNAKIEAPKEQLLVGSDRLMSTVRGFDEAENDLPYEA